MMQAIKLRSTLGATKSFMDITVMTTFTESDLEADPNIPTSVLAKKILSRLPMAKQLPFKEVSIGNWRPESAKCHDNAKQWVESNKGWRVVYGWLVESFVGFHYLNAHSVVQNADGRLFDITPYHSAHGQALPFVPHPSDDEQFREIVFVKKQALIQADNDDTADYR